MTIHSNGHMTPLQRCGAATHGSSSESDVMALSPTAPRPSLRSSDPLARMKDVGISCCARSEYRAVLEQCEAIQS
eukprot:6210197-Pleurochrysis_carterae.AAC.1